MKMQRVLWIILRIFACFPTPGICYNKHRYCVDGYEFIIHERKRTFDSANHACTNEGFELAKIDSLKKTKLINKYLKNPEAYWIGLKYERGSWRWRDRTIAPPSSSISYQNWARGEPNNINYNCVLIDSGNNRKWTAISCSFQIFQFFYICHKRIQFNMKVNPSQLTIVKPGKYEISCTSGYLSCTSAPLRWKRHGQFLNDTDILVLQATNISVAGTYTCQKTADGAMDSKTVDVSVQGSPTQVKVTSTACTPNITIEWMAHPLAIGFLHKVVTYPSFNSIAAFARWTTPHSKDQALELTSLLPLTNYTVEITACRDRSSCPSIYRKESTVLTKGITNAVENVELKIESFECILSWTRPESIGDDVSEYEITLFRRITQSRVPSLTNHTEHRTNRVFFTFPSLPNRNYTASVKAISCSGKSAAADAKGFCYQPPQAPGKLVAPAESNPQNNTRYLRITVPSEDDGLISCLIVIVSSQVTGGVIECEEPVYTSACLKNMLKRCENDNIAVAISSKKFAFKSELEIALGDNTTTWCAPHLTSHISSDKNYMDENNDRCHNRIITAQNKILNDSIAYKVYAVAVVPNGKDLTFRRSMVTILRQSNSFNFDTFLPGFGMATLLFAAILLVWKLISLRKCKKIRSVSDAAGNLDPKLNEVCEDVHQDETGQDNSPQKFQTL